MLPIVEAIMINEAGADWCAAVDSLQMREQECHQLMAQNRASHRWHVKTRPGVNSVGSYSM